MDSEKVINISQVTGMFTGTRDRVRELVRLRDKQTCQNCGDTWVEGMRKFDVHHTDEAFAGKDTKAAGMVTYDRNNMDKLITFCHRCHLGIHWRKIIYVKPEVIATTQSSQPESPSLTGNSL